MATTLTAKGQVLLEDLPHYYATDRNALAAIDAAARELQRVEDFLEHLRTNWFPQNADDTYGILSLWESILKLPVAPAALSLAQRRDRAVAAYRKQSVSTGRGWSEAIDRLLGASVWSVEENQPTSQSLRLSVPDTTDTAMQRFVRAITPANLALTFQSATGFRVDISQVDIDVLS